VCSKKTGSTFPRETSGSTLRVTHFLDIMNPVVLDCAAFHRDKIRKRVSVTLESFSACWLVCTVHIDRITSLGNQGLDAISCSRNLSTQLKFRHRLPDQSVTRTNNSYDWEGVGIIPEDFEGMVYKMICSVQKLAGKLISIIFPNQDSISHCDYLLPCPTELFCRDLTSPISLDFLI
jgi:hypothetical protein